MEQIHRRPAGQILFLLVVLCVTQRNVSKRQSRVLREISVDASNYENSLAGFAVRISGVEHEKVGKEAGSELGRALNVTTTQLDFILCIICSQFCT